MGQLKDLPTGQKFTSYGFKKKFYSSSRSGELQNLGKHQDTINAIAKKRQSAIRAGQYDSHRRLADYKEVLKSSSNLTQRDKKHVKKLFEHWSKAPEPAKSSTINSVPAKPAAIKKANIKKARLDRALPSSLQKGNSSPGGSKIFGRGTRGNLSAQSPSLGGGTSTPSSTPRPPRLVR